jgi:hypothetical protein
MGTAVADFAVYGRRGFFVVNDYFSYGDEPFPVAF